MKSLIDTQEHVKIPHHSFLAIATAAQVEALEAHPAVEWVGDFKAEYKFPATLDQWQRTHLAGVRNTVLVIVLHSVASMADNERMTAHFRAGLKLANVAAEVLPSSRKDRAYLRVRTYVRPSRFRTQSNTI